MNWSSVHAAASVGASFAPRANHLDVEDAAQEVCLALLMGKPIRSPNMYGKFYAQNLCRRRRPETFEDVRVSYDALALGDDTSWVWSAVDEACSSEESLVIRNRYIGRMTIAELMVSTGWPRCRVTGLLKSGLRKLREALDGLDE